MSLATLNKQRSSDKQAQSIRTTVTISKVLKTSVGPTSPIIGQSRKITPDEVSEKSEPSIASSDSPKTVREASKSSDEIPFADDSIGKKKELMKEKFMSEGAEMSRRGELWDFSKSIGKGNSPGIEIMLHWISSVILKLHDLKKHWVLL